MIKNTGVFASKEDIDLARGYAKVFNETPVIFVHGKWLPELAEIEFKGQIDALAMKYGLPEPSLLPNKEVNHYGMSGKGEFTTYEEDKND